MARKFFSGNSLEQAIIAAAKDLKIDPDRIAYKEREKKHGVKVSRRVVIEVDLDAPEIDLEAIAKEKAAQEAAAQEAAAQEAAAQEAAAQEAAAQEAAAQEAAAQEAAAREAAEAEEEASEEDEEDEEVEETEDDSDDDEEDDSEDEDSEDEDLDDEDDEDEDDEDLDDEDDEDEDDEDLDDEDDEDEDDEDDEDDLDEEEALQLAIGELLEFMKLEADIKIKQNDGLFEIALSNGDEDFFVEEDGHLLHTMDYLVPRLVRGFIGRSFPCKVDYDGFRAQREDDLKDLAKETAENVVESGKSKTLDPMNPADRRQVHMSLADFPGVETESVGNGFFKRVRVTVSRET